MTTDGRFEAAAKRFMLEPEALTPDDLAALAAVDEELHDRAVSRRDETLSYAASVRHAKSLGQPAPKLSDNEVIASNVVDTIRVALAKPRARIRALEQQNKELSDRLLALEARVNATSMVDTLEELGGHS